MKYFLKLRAFELLAAYDIIAWPLLMETSTLMAICDDSMMLLSATRNSNVRNFRFQALMRNIFEMLVKIGLVINIQL